MKKGLKNLNFKKQEYKHKKENNQEIQHTKRCTKEPKGCVLFYFNECKKSCPYYR